MESTVACLLSVSSSSTATGYAVQAICPSSVKKMSSPSHADRFGERATRKATTKPTCRCCASFTTDLRKQTPPRMHIKQAELPPPPPCLHSSSWAPCKWIQNRVKCASSQSIANPTPTSQNNNFGQYFPHCFFPFLMRSTIPMAIPVDQPLLLKLTYVRAADSESHDVRLSGHRSLFRIVVGRKSPV